MISRPATLVKVAAALCTVPFMMSAFARAEDRTPLRFDIGEQSLASALSEFARQSRQELLFSPQVVLDKRSEGVSGEYPPLDALEALLDGTGLRFSTTPSGAILIQQLARPDANTRSATGSDLVRTPGPFSRLRLAQAPARTIGGEPPASPAATGSAATLEEIVVTAQKRAQGIMSVPMSIAALDSQVIANRGLVSFGQYLRSVPAVAYVDQGPGQNIFIIRGAFGEPFNTGPTVGVYFGDVPLAGLALGASADVKLIDMQRIEVLRGPQGTLYGSNSLSGTIRHIPTAPQLSEREARLAAGYSSTAGNGAGNDELEGMINLPLLDERLALRVVGYRIHKTGFVKNIAGDDPALQTAAAFVGATDQAVNQDHVGDSRIEGARASLLWNPIDPLQIGFTYLRQEDAVDDRPFAQRGRRRHERSTYRFGPVVGEDDALSIDLEISNLTMDYRLPWGSLFSSTALVEQDARRLWDIGAFTPVSGFLAPMPQDSVDHGELFTEELRFTSDFAGRLQIIAGLFYEDSEQPTRQTSYYTGTAALNPVAPGAVEITSFFLDRQVEQKAAFGEASYALTDQLKLTLGARFFDYDTVFVTNRDRTANPVTRPLSFQTTRGSESGTTYKAGLEYKPTPNTLTYALFSQGFRLGRPKTTELLRSQCDHNNDGLIDGTQLSATDPLIASDTLDNYEVGAKATLLAGRATVGASAYHNDWNDIPVVLPPGSFQACPLLSATFNAGKVRAQGFEIEGALQLAGLQVDLGIGYVDSELAVTSPLGPRGARMNNTPKENGHVGAEYRFDVAGRESYVRADYSYYGEWYAGLGETGRKYDSYGILDLSAGVTFDRFDVRVFADNLADEYAITSDSSFPVNGIYLVQPRTIGLKIGASF